MEPINEPLAEAVSATLETIKPEARIEIQKLRNDDRYEHTRYRVQLSIDPEKAGTALMELDDAMNLIGGKPPHDHWDINSAQNILDREVDSFTSPEKAQEAKDAAHAVIAENLKWAADRKKAFQKINELGADIETESGEH